MHLHTVQPQTSLLDRASSTVEKLSQAADLITYIRLVQQLTVDAPP